jgi:hypothetical protein
MSSNKSSHSKQKEKKVIVFIKDISFNFNDIFESLPLKLKYFILHLPFYI